MNHPSTTTDSQCRDCAYMHPDRDGGRWCSSPQVLKHMGRSTYCAWEIDYFEDRTRCTVETQRCGPKHLNFVKRDFV